MDGDVAAVGATPSGLPGRVWIYRRSGFEWKEEDFLMAPVPEPSDSFGSSIDVRGDYLIVGSYRADIRATDAGAAYIYQYNRTSHSWNYITTLLPSEGEEGDRFGRPVAIDDSPLRAAVGAQFDIVDGVMYAGSAYVYGFDGEEWTEEAHLFETEPGAGNAFGTVELLDDLLFVGAHADEAAYLYKHTKGGWTFLQELIPQSPSFASWFGRSVALSHDRIVVGAPDSDDGYVFTFIPNRITGQWEYETTIQPSEPVGVSGIFGIDVSFGADNNTILVGASNDSGAGFESGAAYLMHVQPDSTVDSTKFFASDISVDDCFGASVAASGDFAVVGAPCRDPGATYFFTGITPIDCNDNGASDGCDIFEGLSDDLDGDGVPDECAPGMSGDLDSDGDVDFVDLLILLDSWGECQSGQCDADLDGSGDVAFADLIVLLSNWSE